MSEIRITQEGVDALISESVVDVLKLGEKTTVVSVTLPSGFEIVESSSCVDPANYDQEVGRRICLDRIRSRLWELEGYRLQCSIVRRVVCYENSALAEPTEVTSNRTQKRQDGVVKEYSYSDQILSEMKISDPCPVRIKVDEKDVRLYIGRRDWQWDRETGKFIGCGTAVETTGSTHLSSNGKDSMGDFSPGQMDSIG